MNDLSRVIKKAGTAFGCLVSFMLFFGGTIALSDYSVAQAHDQPGATDGTTVAGIVTFLALAAGIALLVMIVRGRRSRPA